MPFTEDVVGHKTERTEIFYLHILHFSISVSLSLEIATDNSILEELEDTKSVITSQSGFFVINIEEHVSDNDKHNVTVDYKCQNMHTIKMSDESIVEVHTTKSTAFPQHQEARYTLSIRYTLSMHWHTSVVPKVVNLKTNCK